MLLKRSPLSDSGDDYYRQILPVELADARLSPETTGRSIATLCAETSRNPNVALILVVLFSEADDLAIRAFANILSHPPRPLNMNELDVVLSIVAKYLPYRFAEDSEFPPKSSFERLARLAKELDNIEEASAKPISIRQFALQLLRNLGKIRRWRGLTSWGAPLLPARTRCYESHLGHASA